MVLFIKSLPRLWSSTVKDLNRHFSMTFSSIFSIAVALLIASLMIVSALNIEGMVSGLENQFVIQVSLSPSLSQEDIQSLTQEIQNMDHVAAVEYSTKEEELETLIEENGAMFEQYRGQRNPLYDILEVQMDEVAQASWLTDQLESLPGVVSVDYGGWIILTMMQLFSAARFIGIVLVAVMVILAIFLIRASIKMTLATRVTEIAIMRQVGAYNWYILTPLVFEGILIGLAGAILPCLILLFGYPAFYAMANGMLSLKMFSLIPPYPLSTYLCACMLLAGVFIGMTGSWLAAHKFLKETR